MKIIPKGIAFAAEMASRWVKDKNPGPWTDDQVGAAVVLAIQGERNRCAIIATHAIGADNDLREDVVRKIRGEE